MFGFGDRFDYYVLFSITGDPVWMHTLNSGKYVNTQIYDAVLLTERSGFSASKDAITVGSLDVTLLASRMDSEYIDLSLLDFGSLEANLGVTSKGIDAGFMVALYNPSIAINMGKVHIVLTGYVGGVGAKFSVQTNGFQIGISAPVGAEISITIDE